MPRGRGYGKKRYGRGRAKATKAMRRARVKRGTIQRLNSTNQGYLNVNRRLPVLATSATTTQGVVELVDPTFDCIQLGAPTPVIGGLGNVYDVPFSMTFQLDQMASFSEFTTLFDQYKINAVKVLLRSYANTDGTLGFPMPWVECWNDHDSNVPPTVTLSREIMGVKHKYFNATKNVISMYVRPKPKINVQLQPGILPTRTQWIDCGLPTVQHFAIKGIIHNYALPAVTTGNNRIEFDVTINASFKDIQ